MEKINVKDKQSEKNVITVINSENRLKTHTGGGKR